MKIELRKTFQFEAAHLLPNLPITHKCRRLHGHSFQVEIVVHGAMNPELGWLSDYAQISEAFKPLFDRLDHFYLNEIPGLEKPLSVTETNDFGADDIPVGSSIRLAYDPEALVALAD